MKNPEDVSEEERGKVLKALEGEAAVYLTASSIAKKTKVRLVNVEKVLKNNGTYVRVSLAKAPDGSRLFASRKKVSALGDVWNAFKAVNKAKYG